MSSAAAAAAPLWIGSQADFKSEQQVPLFSQECTFLTKVVVVVTIMASRQPRSSGRKSSHRVVNKKKRSAVAPVLFVTLT